MIGSDDPTLESTCLAKAAVSAFCPPFEGYALPPLESEAFIIHAHTRHAREQVATKCLSGMWQLNHRSAVAGSC